MDLDIKYIKIAIFLLKKIIGTTFPNPPVVSLIVESNSKKKSKSMPLINKISFLTIIFSIFSFSGILAADLKKVGKFKDWEVSWEDEV